MCEERCLSIGEVRPTLRRPLVVARGLRLVSFLPLVETRGAERREAHNKATRARRGGSLAMRPSPRGAPRAAFSRAGLPALQTPDRASWDAAAPSPARPIPVQAASRPADHPAGRAPPAPRGPADEAARPGPPPRRLLPPPFRDQGGLLFCPLLSALSSTPTLHVDAPWSGEAAWNMFAFIYLT